MEAEAVYWVLLLIVALTPAALIVYGTRPKPTDGTIHRTPKRVQPLVIDTPCPRCNAPAGISCHSLDTGAPRVSHLQRIAAAHKD